MPRTTSGADVPSIPAGLIDAAQIARQVHSALEVLNQLLAHAEPGTLIEANKLFCLLKPIEGELYGAVDELDPLTRRVQA